MIRFERFPSVAFRQDGVFTAAQALAAGWTAWQVRKHRRKGIWVPVAGRGLISRGYLRTGPGERDETFPPRALARAAQLTWPDAVTCRQVAAALHGFPVTPGCQVDVLTVPGRRSGRGLRPHAAPPDPEIETLSGGLRVTGKERTALDCLTHLPFEEALDLYAWVSTRGVVTFERLAEEAGRWTGRRGAVQLRRLATVTREGAVSGAEYRLHRLLRSAGLGGWSANVPIVGADGVPAVVDVAFIAERLLVEIDGERAHQGRESFIRDRRRQNALVAAGYVVLRFTWWDLTERPEEVIGEIRRELDRLRAATCTPRG